MVDKLHVQLLAEEISSFNHVSTLFAIRHLLKLISFLHFSSPLHIHALHGDAAGQIGQTWLLLQLASISSYSYFDSNNRPAFTPY